MRQFMNILLTTVQLENTNTACIIMNGRYFHFFIVVRWIPYFQCVFFCPELFANLRTPRYRTPNGPNLLKKATNERTFEVRFEVRTSLVQDLEWIISQWTAALDRRTTAIQLTRFFQSHVWHIWFCPWRRCIARYEHYTWLRYQFSRQKYACTRWRYSIWAFALRSLLEFWMENSY